MPVPIPGALSSRIELSASAFRANVAAFRAVAGPTRKIGAVLKGNAYGHGFSEILPLAHAAADALYVITPGEGLAVRQLELETNAIRRPVLVIGAVAPEELCTLAEQGIEVVVADRSYEDAIPLLRARRLSARVHVHLDTGLGREGFTLEQLRTGAADAMGTAKDVLEVAGVLSHFANTEDVTEQSYASTQLEVFELGFETLQERLGLSATTSRHFAASAAALVLPPSRFDVARVGISLYGLWPSTETRLSAKVVLGSLPALTPVLSWKCPSQVVKWLPAGSFVGYGCTWRCQAPTRVAVLPVGYWDGYPRLASGKAHVLVNGKRCPVLGRVMMNHLIVDVTAAVSDERPLTATLLGRDGDETISAELLAGWAQTIHYELLTRLGAHIPRKVLE